MAVGGGTRRRACGAANACRGDGGDHPSPSSAFLLDVCRGGVCTAPSLVQRGVARADEKCSYRHAATIAGEAVKSPPPSPCAGPWVARLAPDDTLREWVSRSEEEEEGKSERERYSLEDADEERFFLPRLEEGWVVS